MTASDELHKLTDKAKEAEEHATKARHQARADLEQSVHNAQAAMQAAATKQQERAQASHAKVSSWWQEQQAAWNAHIEQMRQDMAERKAKHQAEGAELRAEQAEVDAYFAIDFAYGAIEAADYAVLDAILARETADEAAAMTAGQTR